MGGWLGVGLGVSYPFEQHLMCFPPDNYRPLTSISEDVKLICEAAIIYGRKASYQKKKYCFSLSE